MQNPERQPDPGPGPFPEFPHLAEEVELFIEPDGSVTFADLAVGVVPIAQALSPDYPVMAGGTEEPPADAQSTLLEEPPFTLRQRIRRLLSSLGSGMHLEENYKRAYETQQRALDDLQQQIETQQALIDKLRAEAAQTVERQAEADRRVRQLVYREMFRAMQQVAVQVPTFRQAIESGADLQASDLLPLIGQVEIYLGVCGFERIGEVGGQTAFDPARHQISTAKSTEIQPGDTVRVRYVGYSLAGEVLVKAQVASLPGEVE